MMNAIFQGAAAAIALAMFCLVYVVVRHPSPPAPTLGLPGMRRHQALAASPLFRGVEPIMRKLSGLMQVFAAPELRRKLNKVISDAGHPLGLSADDFLVLSLLVGLGLCCAVAGIYERDVFVMSVALLAGAFAPHAMITGRADRRRHSIYRELPLAIDLIALCMSAGLSFQAAVRQVAAGDRSRPSALDEELRMTLQEIELGHSRKQAFLALAERVRSAEVSEFVSAIIQSEDRGNPLSETLTIQAGVLRARRSFVAEEAATKASGLIMGPLMMMVVALMLMIGAPLFLAFSGAMST